MTSSEPLTREDLFELAALDAYGLLDDYEAALFTRSFHHASASVQDEILLIQSQLAANESLLPDEDPPPALRGAVLGAVAGAIESETSRLAPLATIGGRPAPATRRERERDAGRATRVTTWLYRAAIFALIASLGVVLVFYSRALQSNSEIAMEALTGNTREYFDDVIGPELADMRARPGIVHVVLRPGDADGSAWGVVYADVETGDLLLVGDGLDHGLGPNFTFQVTGANGQTTSIRSFRGTGDVFSANGTVLADLLEGATFQVVTMAGDLVLTS